MKRKPRKYLRRFITNGDAWTNNQVEIGLTCPRSQGDCGIQWIATIVKTGVYHPMGTGYFDYTEMTPSDRKAIAAVFKALRNVVKRYTHTS